MFQVIIILLYFFPGGFFPLHNGRHSERPSAASSLSELLDDQGFRPGLATNSIIFHLLIVKNIIELSELWKFNDRPLIEDDIGLFCSSQQLPHLGLGPFEQKLCTSRDLSTLTLYVAS